ncbi:MAG: hypothetical protein U0892_06120 [Pirellulales bacterium]
MTASAVALMKASADCSIDICWLQLDSTTLDDTTLFAFLIEDGLRRVVREVW